MKRLCSIAALAFALACSRKPAAPPAPAAGAPAVGMPAPAVGTPAAGAPAAAAPVDPEEQKPPPGTEGLPSDDEVKPVYSAFAGAPLPLAQKLCGALHDLPVQRRAACCKSNPGLSFGGECVKIVSAALRSGGVALDAAAVDRCVAAQEKALDGCSWVGGNALPLVPECDGLLTGRRKANEVCRSSLECGEGLRCSGVGPLNPGRCAAPAAAGQVCLIAVDSLSVYSREELDAHHPECNGFCGHHKCEAAQAVGAACSLPSQCGPKNHCDGKKCVAGPTAAKGEPCTGETCAAGLRCVGAKCVQPKSDGDKCASDLECLGGCLPKTHVCGARCDAF